jgi:phage-related protein
MLRLRRPRNARQPLDNFATGRLQPTMARIDVLLYQEGDGTPPPLVTWLDGLPEEARIRCLARLALLEEHGHDLRRPHADYLEDDIYELRVKVRTVNYRILYFFHGRTAVVASHGFAKERRVPPGEIRLAVERKERFRANPRRHTFRRE